MDKTDETMDRMEQKIDLLIDFMQQQKEDISTLKEDVGILKSKVDILEEKFDVLENKVDNIENKVSKNTDDISIIKKNIKKLFQLREIDNNNIARILTQQIEMKKDIKSFLERMEENDLEHEEFHLKIAKLERKVQR